MELYIRIVNAQPFEHPIFGDNFRQAFPDIDVNNLPAEFARFERVECPNLATTFQVDEVTYQWVGNIVRDVWTVREMNVEEREQKIQNLIANAYSTVEYMKGISQEKISTAPNAAVTQAWTEYFNKLHEWVLVDPLNPNIPQPPIISPDGRVVSLDASGSAPNVIG